MATKYYRSNNSDWNTDANWSSTTGGGADTTFPTSLDDAIFDNNSGNCTLDANAAALSITIGTVGALYTGTLNAGSFDVAIGSGGLDCTYGGSATISMGSGTWAFTGGDFDFGDIGTLNGNASVVSFNGTCAWIAKNATNLWDVTIEAGADVNLTVIGGIEAQVINLTKIHGKLTINNPNSLKPGTVADIEFKDGGELTGTGTLRFRVSTIGHGITEFDSGFSMSVATVFCDGCDDGWVFAPGVYNSDVIVRKVGAGYLNLTAGSYSFSSFGLFTSSADHIFLTVATGTNVTTGDLTIDLDSTGNITVTNTGVVNWTITGDVIDERTGGGTFLWTKGTGTITLSGAANQDIDFMGQTIEGLIVDKSAGALVLGDDFTTGSFTGTNTGTGDFDPNGKTITITNDCDWAAAFTFDGIGADVMNGSDWQIGGNFTCDGQTLPATAGWDLDASGTAVASGVGDVAYSTAGSTAITAIGWTDSGSNSGWVFNGPVTFAKEDVFGNIAIEGAAEVELDLDVRYRYKLIHTGADAAGYDDTDSQMSAWLSTLSGTITADSTVEDEKFELPNDGIETFGPGISKLYLKSTQFADAVLKLYRIGTPTNSY